MGSTKPRVLVIDDEPGIGRACSRLLSAWYTTTYVESGEEALALIRSGVRFDVGLVDLLLRGISGESFWRAVEEIDPLQAARLLIHSGACSVTETSFMARKWPRTVRKPASCAELREAIDAVIDVYGRVTPETEEQVETAQHAA